MLCPFFHFKPGRLFFSFQIFCLAMFTLTGQSLAEDPRGHIQEIGDAIDSADAESFVRLVDIDAILNNALEVFVEEATRPENASRLPPMLALIVQQLKGVKGPSPVRDLLLGEGKNFVLAGISSGAFAGRKPESSSSQGLLAPLFESASLGRKEIRNIGQPRQTAKGWLVPFVIYDHGNELEYPVKALLEQKDGDLKLTGLENMRQLIYQIGEESAAAGQ